MSGDAELGILAAGHASLCFNKDEFLKESFSVDQFICDYKKHVPLETLRDDLNVYLRILKNAMIELINKDYADFVNLSTNLVGLDKVINNLTLPLGQLKEEILNVKRRLDDVMLATKEKLEKRQRIRDKKLELEHLMNINLCIEKIEKLLNVENTGEHNKFDKITLHDVQSDLTERVAAEFNQLHFHLNKTRDHVHNEKIKLRINYSTRVLQQNLEQSFLTALDNNDVQQLSRCLRIYATIDQTKEVEDIFRTNKVRPFMLKTFPESVGNINSEMLQIIYVEVLHFVPKYCDVLKLACRGTHSSEIIHDYDFIINAIWPEFVSRMEVRMLSIVVPTDPDTFHEKYLLTMNFLEQFEQLCGSQVSVKRLREHSSYTLFMNKWNLPVYFQIRFNEIAGKLEMTLLSPWDLTNNDPEDFQLVLSQKLWECVTLCWSPTVYLSQLCHRFWKLTLQLFSRYCEWIKSVVSLELVKQQDKDENVESSLQLLESTKPALNGVNVSTTLVNYIFLVRDITLITSKFNSFRSDTINPLLMALDVDNCSFVKGSLEEFSDHLVNQIPRLCQAVVVSVSEQCKTYLKLVSDIPRLFRRTNREVPSKPSVYVANAFQPLQKFTQDASPFLLETMRNEWSSEILACMTQQYYYLTSNVLTSIKKMEESLSRLKKGRDKGLNTISASASGMSDDDKIRFQLYLDIESYGKQIEELNFDRSKIEMYQGLVELVESARNSPSMGS